MASLFFAARRGKPLAYVGVPLNVELVDKPDRANMASSDTNWEDMDYYDLLGVSREASTEEIKKA